MDATDEMRSAVRYWGLDPWVTVTCAYTQVVTYVHPEWWEGQTPILPLHLMAAQGVALRVLAKRYGLAPGTRLWKSKDGFWNLGDSHRTVCFGPIEAQETYDKAVNAGAWTWDGVRYIETSMPETKVEALERLLSLPGSA